MYIPIYASTICIITPPFSGDASRESCAGLRRILELNLYGLNKPRPERAREHTTSKIDTRTSHAGTPIIGSLRRRSAHPPDISPLRGESNVTRLGGPSITSRAPPPRLACLVIAKASYLRQCARSWASTGTFGGAFGHGQRSSRRCFGFVYAGFRYLCIPTPVPSRSSIYRNTSIQSPNRYFSVSVTRRRPAPLSTVERRRASESPDAGTCGQYCQYTWFVVST